jgi:hypothetical protein
MINFLHADPILPCFLAALWYYQMGYFGDFLEVVID